jgi:hydroxymethylpyrimidine pyrophosphatase-like HAD family hydrolase
MESFASGGRPAKCDGESMRYHALVCDYDGTLAFGGRMKKEVAEALGRVRASGRKLILVTGRELEDLLLVCPEIDLFDGVVAENGAVLFWPTDRKEILLCEKPRIN